MERIFACFGALSASFGVMAGAFGAHALKGKLQPEMLAVFEVGVRYQMYHAFALFVTAWVVSRWAGPLVNLSGYCFIVGTLLFSGSLYFLSTSGVRWVGAITPFGGVILIAGWLLLAWAIIKS